MACACRAQRGYDGEWLGGTFSRAVFLGNGLIAILAGLVAHSLVETLSLGPVAPFDAAAIVMLLGLFFHPPYIPIATPMDPSAML